MGGGGRGQRAGGRMHGSRSNNSNYPSSPFPAANNVVTYLLCRVTKENNVAGRFENNILPRASRKNAVSHGWREIYICRKSLDGRARGAGRSPEMTWKREKVTRSLKRSIRYTRGTLG